MAEPCPALLPDHVIEDIFARLPAKLVHRCRCLSRAWAATLASQDFRDLHLRLANLDGSPRVLLLQEESSSRDDGRSSPEIQAWSPANPGGTTLMEIPSAICTHTFGGRGVFRFPTTTRLAPRLLTQHCRGLVVIEATRSGLRYVFNPSSGQLGALPQTPCTGRDAYTSAILSDYGGLGLGYDTYARKHKVVHVYYLRSGKDIGCEVYVVNSGGPWRRAHGGPQESPGWVLQNQTSVFAQGHVHWLAERYLGAPSKDTFLISFSVTDEKFLTVTLPSIDIGMERNYRLKHYLTELGGRLCLFRTELSLEINQSLPWPCRHDIWLLRDHGTSGWDLHCRIDLDTLPPKVASFMRYGDGIIPLAMIDGGRRIIFIRPRFKTSREPNFKLCAYNPLTCDMENLLDDKGLVANYSMVLRHVALYEESLASPGQQLKEITCPLCH